MLFLNILNQIKNKSKSLNSKIVFDEWKDERIIEALLILTKEKLLTPVLTAKKSEKDELFKILAEKKISGVETIIRDNFEIPFAKELSQLKNISEKEAKELIKQNHYFSAMLLKNDYADGIVSGSLSPTAEVIRPALKIIGTKKDVKRASSFFLMLKEDKKLIFADCGFQINPNEEELAEIAILSANSAKFFDIDPKVALLSFSTKGSSKDPISEKVRLAKKQLDKKRIEFEYDGELQVDAALDEKTRKLKSKDGMLTSNANILIFPDLSSGNIGYKLVKILGGYNAYGPIIQGLKKPVNDLSRGCSTEEIIITACITAIMGKNEI